jgi:ADP-heptose:LPS heptosyltransferase
VLRSKVVRNLFALSGKKVAAVDKGRDEKKALTREENKVFQQLTPMFERHAKVFEQLGFSINLSNPKFPEPQLLDQQIRDVTGNKDGVWIGIAPFAQYDSKVYPNDLMQQVIDDLAQRPDYRLFLFGGKNEIPVLDALANGNENVINMAGKIKFQQELQLISNLDVMLSMDSGNAHIAAMLGVKTVTLWGATHPFTGFAPFGQPLENAIVSDRNQYPKLPTSVYGNKNVDGYENAMRTIAPQKVVEKIKGLL